MVLGGDSCYEGCGFIFQHHILDEHYFALIFCNKCIEVCLKEIENIQKEAGYGPFKKVLFRRFGVSLNHRNESKNQTYQTCAICEY